MIIGILLKELLSLNRDQLLLKSRGILIAIIHWNLLFQQENNLFIVCLTSFRIPFKRIEIIYT